MPAGSAAIWGEADSRLRWTGPLTQSCPRPSNWFALRNLYSITSSARSKIDCGTVRPCALAVLRLKAISNFVDNWTGSSAGGGFLIVPALMFAAGMPIINAIGSSLVAVAAFGATAAFNYARSGLVDWRLAVIFIAGGVGGGLAGGRVA